MKRMLMAFCLFLFIVVSFAIRLADVVSTQHAAAQAAVAVKHWDRAMIHYANALHAWLPVLPERQRVLQEMRLQLFRLEKAGMADLALKGWRRMRAALVSTRGIWGQPDAEALHTANRHIARLAGETDRQGFMSSPEIRTEALQLLESHPGDINRFWGLVQFLLLFGWIGAGVMYLWLPSEDGRRRWFILAAPMSFSGWLVALYLAG